jgi:ligand-binding sensor domain-containing protein
MKNIYCHQYSYILCFILIVVTACSGQSNSTASKNNQPELQINAKNAAQIAEYIVDVFEDKQGNLWFGTMDKGAAKYDGKTLTYLSTKDGLCGNTVVSIAEDKGGDLWFGTHTGATKYDGKTVTNFTEKKGLHGMGCKILVDKKGNVWAGTNHGVFRYNGTAFTKFDLPNPIIKNISYKWELGKVWHLFEDKKGNIWFGRDGYGACKFDGTAFTHFTQKDGLCSNNVSAIIEDEQGDIWFACITSDQPKYSKVGGVSRYNGRTFITYPNLAGLTENDVYTIGKDKQGNVWIGATGFGVYRYDGTKFTLFKETDRMDLTHRFGLQGILHDKNGNLWLGFSGGLFRFNGTAIINVTQNGPWK